jgi:sugar/nucleoside kinase (ribokinase family)
MASAKLTRPKLVHRQQSFTNEVTKPVIQQDRTGCGIASIAALTGQKYAAVKKSAAQLGIEVTDTRLWSDTRYIKRLLHHFHLAAGNEEDFVAWNSLPNCALLAIKWHREKTGPAWHWVVFVRDASGSYVLDPKKALRTHRRTDFGRMKPKWFIRIRKKASRQ